MLLYVRYVMLWIGQIILREEFSQLKSSDNPRKIEGMRFAVFCYTEIGLVTGLISASVQYQTHNISYSF